MVDVTTLAAQVGVPFACVVLLYRLADSTIRENTEAINELTKAVHEFRND